MNWIIYLLLTAIILYCAVVVFYYFFQERFLFVARRLPKSHQFKIPENYEEHFLTSVEKGIINALHFKYKDNGHKDDPRGVLIYFHGNTGNLKTWSAVASEVLSYGFDLIIYDYRGYGKSEGIRSEENLHHDAKVVYDFARKRYTPNQIVLYGRSLGTGIAVNLASRVMAKKLILETPYFSMQEVGQYHFPFLPIKNLLRYTLNSYQWIGNIDYPIYIFHGTKDLIVPYSQAVKLFELVKDNKKNKMVTFRKGKHSNLNSYPLFREKMKQFLWDLPMDQDEMQHWMSPQLN